jgi:hypothetical protein
MRTIGWPKLAAVLLCLAAVCSAQKLKKDQSPPPTPATANAAAEDISGMYSFLKEGEFVQINLEPSGMTGYISREGDMESDQGQFLDYFFNKASIQGHNVSFATKPVHGVSFEFKGHFDHGLLAKSKAEDGYFILRGTLTEIRSDAANKTTSRSHEVEFRSLAQPDEK